MKNLPHIILETANFHGGDAKLLKETVETFSTVDYRGLGIKLHAFKPDNVALPDFSWYPVVKNFYIPAETWKEIIDLAVEKGFKVWLDLFCVYGVEILGNNLDKIHGVKLQPSIQDNVEILDALKGLDLNQKELIMNVSGMEMGAVEESIRKFSLLGFQRIILQCGFQDYPTKIEDTSLKKVGIIKAAFPGHVLSYADHIDAGSDFSRRFPVYAWQAGCDYIEKHICLKRSETKYDFDSALEKEEIEELCTDIVRLSRCYDGDFISTREKKYYEKTLQKPVLKRSLEQGRLVAASDLLFRRTDKRGLNYRELQDLQKGFFILDRGKEKGDTLLVKDYKKPRVGAIVAARMKSSRLKQKAILPIRGMSSVERCLDNCLKFAFTDEVILATSTLEDDAILANYTLNGRAKFWQGDPEDVISRYLGACDKYGIDVIIRVTGDCPSISPEIAEFILKAHFAAGADFTEPRRFAVGSNSQVYNVEALKRVVKLVGKADYSEHMTLYMVNNPKIFKINTVDLPPELVRDYRLTLDYQEDLDMFNALYEKLEEQNLDSNLINVFKILDHHREIVQMNAHKTLVYKTDQDLIRLLNEKTTIKNV